MSAAPEQIVQCLDQLELVSDNPMALKLIAELRIRLADQAAGSRQFLETLQDTMNMQQEKIDDLVLQLEAICREPV